MSKIAVIGGGIAGSSAAVELAKAGNEVFIIEKSSELGGNVKHYGCKAVEVCTKCNLCLVDDVINEVFNNENIKIYYKTLVNDFYGEPGNYTLGIENEGNFSSLDNLDYIVLATGYTKWSKLETGTPEIYNDEHIIWASELEDYLENRLDHVESEDPIKLGYKPESAIFIQCNGSRSIQEKAKYCSKICCGYDYRLARVLKHYYPEIDITMFFMDFQEAGYLQSITFDKLDEEGIDYINCKPMRIDKLNNGLKMTYEDQRTGKTDEKNTQLLILSEGIHASDINETWSKLFNLQLNEYGFLTPIEDEKDTGVFLAGTIKGPKDIAMTISDSKNVAYRIIKQQALNQSKI